MTPPVVLTNELGGSLLSREAQRGALPEWYVVRPTDSSSWRSRAQRIASEFKGPAWLAQLEPAFAAGNAAADRLDRAATHNGVVVTTGQQPGLFGGPLMTLAKALSALEMADALERSTGIPTAPVFWAATDDADFDECSWTKVALSGGTETLRLVKRLAPNTPMSSVPLANMSELQARLEAACGPAVDAMILELVRDAYTDSATVGSAYVSLLRRVLMPLGVSVLDASHSAVREAAGPITRRALHRASRVVDALDRRSRDMRQGGREPQVDDIGALTLVFSYAEQGRRRVTVSEALSTPNELPVELLGPNVLLRPIVERALLPTVAYVGGPAEIAYFAQVSAVAEALDLSAPLILPRWSVTVLEPRVQRALARLHASPEDLKDLHALENRLARAAIPAEVAHVLDLFRRDIERHAAALEVADQNVLVPPASIQSARAGMLHRLQRLERRYQAAIKRRDEQSRADVTTARASLYPDGMSQERALGFVPFLARYGTPLLADMRVHASRHAAAVLGLSASDAMPKYRGQATLA